jgi:hypothetical protein
VCCSLLPMVVQIRHRPDPQRRGEAIHLRWPGCRERSHATRVSALWASIPLAHERCAYEWPVPRTSEILRRIACRSCLSRPRAAVPAKPLTTPFSPNRFVGGWHPPATATTPLRCARTGGVAAFNQQAGRTPVCCCAPEAGRDLRGETVCQLLRAHCVASALQRREPYQPPTTSRQQRTSGEERLGRRPHCGLKQDRHERLTPEKTARFSKSAEQAKPLATPLFMCGQEELEKSPNQPPGRLAVALWRPQPLPYDWR